MTETDSTPALAPGQAEYEAQGGHNFKFWTKVSDGFYSQTSVYNYEMARNSLNYRMQLIDRFEEALKEAIANEEIEYDLAKQFADIFDISLKRDYEFVVNVEFTFTASLGPDDDVDSVVENMSFSADDGYYGTDYEIDNVDYSVIYSNHTEM